MAKNKLTKGTLSLGQIEKDAMPEIKSGLKKNEKRTTLYLDENLYRAIKRQAVMEEITIKDYINNLLRKDCEKKGIL
jgi:predicted DNA binding CopG/RHH family protein